MQRMGRKLCKGSTVLLTATMAVPNATECDHVVVTLLCLQAQTTVLQQQPNGLLIQPQALSNQLGAQPSVVHDQLSSHQMDTLQQQVCQPCSISAALH